MAICLLLGGRVHRMEQRLYDRVQIPSGYYDCQSTNLSVRRLATIIILLCLLSLDSALSHSLAFEVPDNSTENAGNLAVPVSLRSNTELWLSVSILIFGMIIIIVEYLLLRGSELEQVTRTYIVTLIIIGTLFLISAGLDNEQISPALGLFGTIAGYLLGRTTYLRRNTDEKPTSKAD